MNGSKIINFDELAKSPNRAIALQIAEAGLDAINTEKVVNSSVSLKGDILSVQGNDFNLANFKTIKVLGFGKSSPAAALALEKILGSRISEGAVIGLEKIACERIETYAGTHPRPSEANIKAGDRISQIAENSSEDDLVIVLVSGGGSALLCSTEGECQQGIKLYNSFLKAGKTITEINTVRKHISVLKGGGLAKIAYPATVIGLIFSDIPGNNFENVASGPTYKDNTTAADAERIIKENDLGEFALRETPKEDKYFEKVHNFVLVSNRTAVEAMAKKSSELGWKAKIFSTELYDEVGVALQRIFSAREHGTVILSAGEPSIEVTGSGGKGGRNLHLGLLAIKNKKINDNSVFITLASDGMDNSDAAGAIADQMTAKKAEDMGLDPADYAKRFDSYSFFEKTKDIIMTGPTGSNVSDLMILLSDGGEE